VQLARDNGPQPTGVFIALPVGALEHREEGTLQGDATEGPLVNPTEAPQGVARHRVARPVKGFCFTVATCWHWGMLDAWAHESRTDALDSPQGPTCFSFANDAQQGMQTARVA
jgi:hypothetical protein